MSEPRRLAAVILNYRTPAHTRAVAHDLLQSQRPIDDLIVVDNDASDAGVALDLPQAATLRCIETGRNLGFSGGVNVGIRAALAAGAGRVLLVNSDVTVPDDCVGRLERCLDSSRSIGIVGPVVLSRQDPSRVQSLGLSYSTATGRMQQRGFRAPLPTIAVAEIEPVDAVAACAMLVSRAVFDAVGVFDEDYFFSFEDLDFCLRARRAGFVTVIAGRARVCHEGSRSIGADSPRRLYFAARNHLLVASRGVPSTPGLTSALRSASIISLNLAHAIRSRGGSLGARLSAVVHGTSDYFAGRLGQQEFPQG